MNQDAVKQLRFEKWLETERLEIEEDLHKFKDDTLAEFQAKTRLSTLEYIHKVYELCFYGHTCNKEKLK